MSHAVSVKVWFAAGSLLYRAACSCGAFEYFDKYELRAWNEAGAHFASEEYADAYDRALAQFRALNEPQSSGREPEKP